MTRRTWHGLTWRERRQVLRSARRRRMHPDPEIARAAVEWAHQTLAPRQRRARLLGLVLLPFDAAFGGWIGMSLAERRSARTIARAYELTQKQPAR